MSALLLLSLAIGCGDEPRVPSPEPSAAVPDALVLRVAYGSEKKKWMEAMVQRFEATGPKTGDGRPIDVVTESTGSGEAMAAILSGASKPHVYSPASSAYITLLDERWLAHMR